MNLINWFIFSFYLVSILTLIYFVIKTTVEKKKLLALYVQSETDKYFISEQLNKVVEQNSLRELSESDGFIKFISESRDWAFEYIEEVQKALSEFDNTIVPIVEWNKTYGTVLNENLYSPKIEEISVAYEKLKKLLPENNETPNN